MFKIKLEEGKTMEVPKATFWHTSTHILAQAVKKLYPNVQLGIGPAIEQGFYYDFKIDKPFEPSDLIAIENEMKNIVKENYEEIREEISREEAVKLFKSLNEPLKVELINELEDSETISIYRQGDFVDLCRGPHLPRTGAVKAFKLLSTSAVYWKGDENNISMQRIYGISFPKKSMLDEHLAMLEEAMKRNHRKIGKEMKLFHISEEAPGMPIYLPNGMVIKNELEDFWKDLHFKSGYKEIKTPIILKDSLWKQSGHWDHYAESMYFTEVDETQYALKPMNCPGGILAYKTELVSYKDLPIRRGELGLVHRHEKSGELNGLLRVRVFTQDDAHIYCLPEQIEEEIIGVLKLANIIYSRFGLTYEVELSTRPENFMGKIETWDKAENALKNALNHENIPFVLNEGDGAFYGPKIDLHIKDCIGRSWQCGTIQLDFQMPERFEMEYVGADGNRHRPVMIHRAIYGSIDRFMGVLIEHYAGLFPLWLSPIQVKILPINDNVLDYAKEIEKELIENNIRVEIDKRNEKIGYKIREAQLEKASYMLIIGDEEKESKNISVRSRDKGDLGKTNLKQFIKNLLEEIKE